mmetsp:Transcript_88095/g.169552  ORF Transcript_88095/g.169552 Transcript_88095/m.169552 type:complete len:467 (+) Transcript_88095:70-1470(+)
MEEEEAKTPGKRIVETGTETSAPSSKKYRQADESDGVVEVLCFTCRRANDNKVQKSIMGFFSAGGMKKDCDNKADKTNDPNLCHRCRRPMQEKGGPIQCPGDSLKGSGAMPQLKRFKQYQTMAAKQGVPFLISEKQASAMMREPCVMCGVVSPARGHGIARLRRWPDGMVPPDRGGVMGPYSQENIAPACTMCNMMKSYRSVRGLIECATHIASKHTPDENFAEFPGRFSDNVSKRSRSSYITNSSTHTKTHALTNDEFNNIVAQRCWYCHKEPRKPKTLGPADRGHFNGLDRLDSSNRLYTKDTVVACCGDCNMMKYRYPVDGFLEHCRKLARFNAGRGVPPELEPTGGNDHEPDIGADCVSDGEEDAEKDDDGEAGSEWQNSSSGAAETTEKQAEFGKEALNALKVEDLRQRCKEKGLAHSGNKAKLVERLAQHADKRNDVKDITEDISLNPLVALIEDLKYCA